MTRMVGFQICILKLGLISLENSPTTPGIYGNQLNVTIRHRLLIVTFAHISHGQFIRPTNHRSLLYLRSV